MNIELHNLFPTPVMVADFKRDFSQEEMDFFKKQIEGDLKYNGSKGHKYKNKNYISNSTTILEAPEMENLKYDIVEMLYLFIKQIYRPVNDVLPYITQSWLTITKEGEFHHIHNHPNSFLSGTLYIDADENLDSIMFFKPHIYNSLRLYSEEMNSYNNSTHTIKAKTGRIIIFPSHVDHYVAPKVGKNLRTTLTFNSYLKGTIGTEDSLTLLTL